MQANKSLILNSLLQNIQSYAKFKHFGTLRIITILHFFNFLFTFYSQPNFLFLEISLSSPPLHPAVALHQLFMKLVILQLGLRRQERQERQERLLSSWLTVKLTERGNPLVLFTHCFPHTDD